MRFILFLIVSACSLQLNAQGPYCNDNCTASDIKSAQYYLGDVDKNPLTQVSCIPGEPVTGVYLWLAFNVTANNRYELNVVGDILIENTYSDMFNLCLGDYNQGPDTILIDQLNWNCGDELAIANTLFAWANQELGDNPDQCMTCPSVTSKCSQFDTLAVAAPLVADFNFTVDCDNVSGAQTFVFSDGSTGGIQPYSNYVWDFGVDAVPTPPLTSGPNAIGPYSVEYLTGGDKTVSLTITDDVGSESTYSTIISVANVINATISILDGNIQICSGGTVTFSSELSDAGASVTYDWQYEDPILGWVSVGNAPQYTTPILTNLTSYAYRLLVTPASGCTSASNTTVINVVNDPTVTALATQDSICEGGTAILTALISGGTGDTHYQWSFNDNGIWVPVGPDAAIYEITGLGQGTYAYMVSINQENGCIAESAIVTITVVGDPEIQVNSDDGDSQICEGGTVTFTASALGGAGTESYTWSYNDPVFGWIQVGGNGPIYTTNNLTVSGSPHEYQVEVMQNSGCVAASGVFEVVVVNDPTVTAVAAQDSICEGGTAVLTALVSGGTGDTHYQWSFNNNGTWVPVGPDAAIYEIAGLGQGSYEYMVSINQDNGCVAESAIVTITVVGDPEIEVNSDDADLQICEGGTVTFTANAIGGAGTESYSWSYNDPVSGWTQVGGNGSTYTTDILSVSGSPYEYQVELMQNSGCVAASGVFQVTVVNDPTVTAVAAQDSICEGGTAVLTAMVSGGTGDTHYQWFFNNNGTWVPVGPDDATYEINGLGLGSYEYMVSINQDNGCLAESAVVTITVVGDPEIQVNTDDADLQICEGGTVTFTANALGGAGTESYTWYYNNPISGWIQVGGSGSTYTTDNLSVVDSPHEYQVELMQNSGCVAASGVFQVTVVYDPTVIASAAQDSICEGGTAVLIAMVSGGTGDTHYQWSFNNNGTWVPVGPDAATYEVAGLGQGSYEYMVSINQDNGCIAESAIVTITVVGDPEVQVNSDDADLQICEGGTVTFTASALGGAGAESYAWSYNDPVSGWIQVGGSGPVYTTDNLSVVDSPHEYQVDVMQNSGCVAASGVFQVTVVNDPTVTAVATQDSICEGGNGVLTAMVSGGTGDTHYQWFFNNNGTWVPVGPDAATYEIAGLGLGVYEYMVSINQDNGCLAESAIVTITVVGDPEIQVNTDDADLQICEGGTVTFTASALGGAGTESYTWYYNDPVSGWIQVGGSGAIYTTDNLSVVGSPYEYQVELMQNSGCVAASGVFQVTVVNDPTVSALAAQDSICDGGTAVLTALVSGGTGDTHYQWSFNNNGTWVPVGPDAAIYEVNGLGQGTYEYMVSINQDNGCEAQSTIVTITVVGDPEIQVNSDDADLQICEGGTVTFTANAIGGAGTESYNWSYNDPVSGWIQVGGNGPTYTTDILTVTGSPYEYQVEVMQNSGCSDASAILQVNVVNDPTIEVSAADASVCDGLAATLFAQVFGGTGLANYQWQYLDPGIGWQNVGGNSSTYVTPSLSFGNYQYQVIVTQDSGCEVVSAPFDVSAISCTGLICGLVQDLNGNPLSNVVLELYQDANQDSIADAGAIMTVTTDGETGQYCFEDLDPGYYIIQQTQPDNYFSFSDFDSSISVEDPDGDDSVLGPNNIIFVYLDESEFDSGNDFLEILSLGLISGYVTNDIGQPIEGVTIELHADFGPSPDGNADSLITTTVTNSSGFYIFSGIEVGDYVIVEQQPLNYISVSDFDESVDIDDPDGFDGLSPDEDIPVTITTNEFDTDNNFVENPLPGNICGVVEDEFGNSISNVVLGLYADANLDGEPDGAVILEITTVGDAGVYCFDDIYPGDYLIIETQPDNYDSISDFDESTGPDDPDGNDFADGPNDQISVTLDPAENDNDNNFIEDPDFGIVTGHVFNNSGEPIPSMVIGLYADTNMIPDGIGDIFIISTSTDAAGVFSFNGLEIGNYVLAIMDQSIFIPTSDFDESISPSDLDGFDGSIPDYDIPVVLTAGETDADNNFRGNLEPGFICGTVVDTFGNYLNNIVLNLFADENQDGIPEGGVLASVTTIGDSDIYCFEDVPPGKYVIIQVQPDNYESFSDYDASVGIDDPDGDDAGSGPNNQILVILEPNEFDNDNNFVEIPDLGNIVGKVVDNFGSGVSGVIIELYSDNAPQDGDEANETLLATTVTDGFGNYAFNGVQIGNYVIVEQNPAGYLSVSDYDQSITMEDPDGFDGNTPDDDIPVELIAGEIDADNNFVNDVIPGLICGTVTDDSGQFIPNVTLYLYAASPGNMPVGDPIQTVITAGDLDAYCFEDVLPGAYVIVQVQPNNYDSFSDYDETTGPGDPDGDDSGDGPNNQIYVFLEPGEESDNDNNFIEDPNPGSITGNVRDEYAVPIQGVTIHLYADSNADQIPDGGILVSAVTDIFGNYSFVNIEPGKYLLVEVQPVNYSNAEVTDYDLSITIDDLDGDDAFQGPDDNIPVVLMPGEVDADNDFIDNAEPGIVCGNVFDDDNIQINGVVLNLYRDTNGDGIPDGGLVISVATSGDAEGYCFEDVEYGDYVIVQEQPSGYSDLSDYDHSTGLDDPDGNDNNLGPNNLIPVTVTLGELDTDNDFYEIRCGTLPVILGDENIFVCNQSFATIEAVDQGISGLTYTWDFGEGSVPSSAIGPGPHEVLYTWSQSNQDNGAAVILTLSKPGCPDTTAEVARVFVSPPTNATITVDTTDACAQVGRIFIPEAPEILGAIYEWDFGVGAIPTTANTYGPHVVIYTSTGIKNISLSVDPNQTEIANCPDTGYVELEVIECLGSIAGTVSTNMNNAIEGVTIFLYVDLNTDGIPDDLGTWVDFTQTNSSGQYAFTNLDAGNYVIYEIQPAGYISVFDGDTSGVTDIDEAYNLDLLDNNIPVTLMPLEDDIDNIFIETTLNGPGSINGFVFDDENINEKLDAGEGVEGAHIDLYQDLNQDGVPDLGGFVQSAITDRNGFYVFPILMPNDYVIVETQPFGYSNGFDVQSSDGDNVPNIDILDDIIPATIVLGEIDSDNKFKDNKECLLTVTSTDDAGQGSLRAAIACAQPADTIFFHSSLDGDTIRLTSDELFIDKDIYIYAGNVDVTIMSTSVNRVMNIAPFILVELTGLSIIAGPSTIVPSGIENNGDLILNSVKIIRHPSGFNLSLLRNGITGFLIIEGDTQIKLN